VQKYNRREKIGTKKNSPAPPSYGIMNKNILLPRQTIMVPNQNYKIA
jgi:hypothetical protein